MVNIPLEMRIKRIRYREEKRFGNSVLAEGDMHKQQVAFRNAVKNRDKKMLEESVKRLKCPNIVLDGTVDITDNLDKIISVIDTIG